MEPGAYHDTRTSMAEFTEEQVKKIEMLTGLGKCLEREREREREDGTPTEDKLFFSFLAFESNKQIKCAVFLILWRCRSSRGNG